MVDFTGKSQEAPQLAVGRNGKRGFGGGSPHYGFFLGISPGHIARTSSRNKMKNFHFEAPGRFTLFVRILPHPFGVLRVKLLTDTVRQTHSRCLRIRILIIEGAV